jgi:hypothetical protein
MGYLKIKNGCCGALVNVEFKTSRKIQRKSEKIDKKLKKKCKICLG